MEQNNKNAVQENKNQTQQSDYPPQEDAAVTAQKQADRIVDMIQDTYGMTKAEAEKKLQVLDS